MKISKTDFATAVPFGFVVDATGTLTIVGVALQRRLGAEPGMRVEDVFRVVRPTRVESFVDLPIAPKATVLLRAVQAELELKGSTMALDDGALTAFWGGAVVRDIVEFKQRGLQISDFPPSDATPDLLLSMQATRSALDDARKIGDKLKAALLTAEAATEAKARFLATMSHEIRTPLNGFGSMIDLLHDGELTLDQRENLDTMDVCTRSLLVLVNDILEFSKLEAGKIQVSPEPVLLHQAITRITEFFRASARERGVDLRVRIDAPTDLWLLMDADRVRQIVSNLLGNALKFTPKGHVELQVQLLTTDELTIDVRDTGIGVGSENQQRLFEPFVQEDASTTRRFGGTGLGLSISRQLALAMGGDVELVHSDHAGSHFRMCIKIEASSAPVARRDGRREAAWVDSFEGHTVLVAEDDPTNQLIAKKMLQKLGITATVVADGLGAVDVAQSTHFDLILMDLMMPNLNGIEAANRIRAGKGPCSNVPIVAFSAAAFGADRDAAIAAGMSGFLEKPARLDGLRAVLAKYLTC
ncbi:MAG: signal transduction histidine kinase/CheY-like chemotaxis protein [Candidatus Azotimanducaceae bacterium]|jgi:signal transduction histidine kinase/CheY-like chemotaxis protein